MATEFKGEIRLDVRDSTRDWDAILPDRAPEGAPNVLVVLYDDTGSAAWSPYGGRIDNLGNPKDFETFIKVEFDVPVPPSGQYTYYPGTTEVPERSAANVHGVTYKVLAEVEVTPDVQGVIFAHGSRFGGHALFVKDEQVTYAYEFLGVPPENLISATALTSGPHISGVEFTKERMGEHREGIGPLKLYIDDEMVAEDEIRTVLGHFSLCGEGLCIGYDSGDVGSREYLGSHFEFTSDEIVKVVADVADVDIEQHLAAAMARD